MSALKRIGTEVEKTARSSANAVFTVPSSLFVNTLILGKSPLPSIQDATRKAAADIFTLPFRITGVVASETLKGSAAIVGSIAKGTARAVWRNLPIPVPTFRRRR